MSRTPVLLAWSSGKDSAWSLHVLRQSAEVEVVGLLTTIRRYRERQMAATGLRPLFPLWGRATPALAREMLAGGLRARITCLDPRVLPRAFAGRVYDASLLSELPPDVDPCGENGEFHTFAWDGPMFDSPVEVHVGEVVERDGFVFADLLPGRRTDHRGGAEAAENGNPVEFRS